MNGIAAGAYYYVEIWHFLFLTQANYKLCNKLHDKNQNYAIADDWIKQFQSL
jgi:hypothetical protein